MDMLDLNPIFLDCASNSNFWLYFEDFFCDAQQSALTKYCEGLPGAGDGAATCML